MDSSYNYVCLLNIPDQVRMFGSVFHHWEGSGMGEKFVQVAKRHFNTFRSNWHAALILRIVKYHTMSILSGNDIENYDSPHEYDFQNSGKEHMSIHAYKCTYIPRRDLLLNKPIAFVELQSGEFSVCVSLNIYLKLTIESYVKELCGLHYFRWKMDEKVFEPKLPMKRSCLLLPMLSPSGISKETPDQDIGSVYTAIGHDYTDIDSHGNFRIRCLGTVDIL